MITHEPNFEQPTVFPVLERDWKYLLMHKRPTLISDVPFREDVVDESFSELRKPDPVRRNLSLVDRVIRRILMDRSVRIDALIAFNPRDFADVAKPISEKCFPNCATAVTFHAQVTGWSACAI